MQNLIDIRNLQFREFEKKKFLSRIIKITHISKRKKMGLFTLLEINKIN